jgi:hypothetical protein
MAGCALFASVLRPDDSAKLISISARGEWGPSLLASDSPAGGSQRRCRHPCAIGVSTAACFSLCGGKAAKMGAGSIPGVCLQQHPPPARNSVYSSACYWVSRRRAFSPQSLKPRPVAVRTYGGSCHLNPLSQELGPRPTSRRLGVLFRSVWLSTGRRPSNRTAPNGRATLNRRSYQDIANVSRLLTNLRLAMIQAFA